MKIEVKEEHFKFMRMSFGKHEGILFKYVPVGYWHWLSQQHWFFTNDRFFWEKTYYQLKENEINEQVNNSKEYNRFYNKRAWKETRENFRKAAEDFGRSTWDSEFDNDNMNDFDSGCWWKVLNVSKRATTSEIKKAFRKLSKEYHPDLGGESELFIKVKNAYDRAMRYAA